LHSRIETGSDIVDGVSRNTAKGFRDRLREPEFVDLMLRFLRVRFYHDFVRIHIEEHPTFPFEIRDVFLCASDLAT
jgi:hypothetical protein